MKMEGILEEVEPDTRGDSVSERNKPTKHLESSLKKDDDIRKIKDDLQAIQKRLATIEESSKELRRRVDNIETKLSKRTDADSECSFARQVRAPASFADCMKPHPSEFSVDVLPDNSATFLSTNSRPPSDLDIKLYYAAKDGRVEDIRDLISETKSDDHVHCGCNALLTAAWNGHIDVVSELLSNGADVNVVNSWTSESPLHYAAFDGNARMVALLLYNGADANVRNLLGKTPLHIAVLKGFEDCVHLLLDAGADPSVEDNKGKKPSDLCESASILKLLGYFKGIGSSFSKNKIHRK